MQENFTQKINELSYLARNNFRQKNYKKTIEVLETLFNEYDDFIKLNKKIYKDRFKDYNNLMTSYHHLIINKSESEYGNDSIVKFYKYFDEYLKLAKIVKKEDGINSWSDSILKDIFIYNVDMILIEVSESFDINNNIESILKNKLNNLIKNCIKIFSPPFTKKLFFEGFLIKIYEERQNFKRKGKNKYQNFLNTMWMIEVFLENTESVELDYSETRANMMNLMADLIYFYKDEQSTRGEKERKSIEWLEKSLEEHPENQFTKNRIKELKNFLVTTEQINKFHHDATSKIVYLKEEIKSIKNKIGKNNININTTKKLSDLLEQVNIIEGIFRLTKEEKAIFEFVDIEIILKNIVKASEFENMSIECLEFYGKKELVEIDKNYFIIAIRNLLKNSIEAYRRNNIKFDKCPVIISFYYNKWECVLEDKAGGIPEEYLENDRLFDPYISDKGTFQDAGLGLAQVKFAIEIQDGIIEYESDKKGTKFIIKLLKEVD